MKKYLINIFFVYSVLFGIAVDNFAHGVITNPRRWDGFGAQFLHVIDTALYAEVSGFKFLYTPFSAMEHNYDNDTDFLVKKECLINFMNNFEINLDANTPTPNDVMSFFNHYVDECLNTDMYKKIKRIFRENKDFKLYYDAQRFNIAVHIRRPNPHDNRVDGTDTPDDFYINIIDKLREYYGDKNPLFHIYSQGPAENFDRYVADDIVLYLDTTIEYTFTAMVLADVLVMSRSDFSYAAAILSNGIVYYVPYGGHVSLPHWKLATSL